MKYRNPFSQAVPSVFVVCSPFQALCALNAIKVFNIREYKFILSITEDIRNQQIFNLLESNNIKYLIYDISKGISNYDKLLILKSRDVRYCRAFIGDPRNILMYYIALNEISGNGAIVFLDDGNDNIFLLKGSKPEQPLAYKMQYKYIEYACAWRSISLNNLYTVYGDILNRKYNIKINRLELLSEISNYNSGTKDIYIIGTNHSMYCGPLHISEKTVENNLTYLFSHLKNKYGTDHRVVYVTHGRDKADFPVKLCKRFNVEFVRPKVSVELLILGLKLQPFLVCAYTSTALYNIKLFCPDTNIVDIQFSFKDDTRPRKQIKVISDYYSQHGIETWLSDLNGCFLTKID